MTGFRLLVIADVHYAPGAADAGHRRCSLGLELLRRAVEDAKNRGGFDAVALMGDLLNDGMDPASPAALEQVREQLRQSIGDCPLLVTPGNHDGDSRQLLTLLGRQAGLHRIGGYRFIVFADRFAGDDVCTRSLADRRQFQQWAASPEGGPVVVLQHNPMNPAIEDAYPYMLTNRQEVMDDYSRAGVLLSISGHYHPGQALNVAGGVHYLTAPTVCKSPFKYMLITLAGREIDVQTRQLQLPTDVPLVDWHAHTEFAYCGRDISAAKADVRARVLGLSGICLTEHAPQLYCGGDDFWAARHIHQPKVWRDGPAAISRMAEFRRQIVPMRNDFVKIGLEVELDADGTITLRSEDRDVADVLLGAIHWLTRDIKTLDDAELAAEFMKTCKGLIDGGIDILAHPFRLFTAHRRKPPVDLYKPLAEMLAAARVAAEVNFHNYLPDPAFFECCIRHGVKIACGSDGHVPHEMAALTPHLAMLRQIAAREDVGDLLMRF